MEQHAGYYVSDILNRADSNYIVNKGIYATNWRQVRTEGRKTKKKGKFEIKRTVNVEEKLK